MHRSACSPIAPMPCVSETDVVVLPSPALVGVIAVTQMILPSGLSFEPVEHREADLGLVAAVRLDLGVLEAGGRRDLLDRAELGLLCDLETALHARRTPVRGCPVAGRVRPSRRAGGYARAPRTARRSLRDSQRWRTRESEARPSGEGVLQEAIGRQIREFRTALGMTVAELGRQSDLSPGAISKIERGLTPPSLASLSAIAGALAVPVTALFRKHEEQRDASYVEAGKGLVIERRGTRVGHRYELLGHTISGRVAIEPYLVTLTEESEVFPLFQHAGRRVHPPARGRGRLPRRRLDLPPHARATPCSSTATSRTAPRSSSACRSACWRSSRAPPTSAERNDRGLAP